jgi:hypothetical protein
MWIKYKHGIINEKAIIRIMVVPQWQEVAATPAEYYDVVAVCTDTQWDIIARLNSKAEADKFISELHDELRE